MKKIITAIFLFLFSLTVPGNVLASSPSQTKSNIISGSNIYVTADGSTTGSITIQLYDSDGNAVSGHSVTLSSSNDSSAVFNNNQTTDSSGYAHFTVKSTTVGQTKITMYDNDSNTYFTDWFLINFYSATLGCYKVPDSPNFVSVVSNSSGHATLTWVDSADPVSNYLVSYGTSSGNYIYGNANIGSQGTTSYTVGSLIDGKTYYFVVAASNNCGASSFSKEISVTVNPPVTAKPITTTVKTVATPEPTAEPTTVPVSEEVTNATPEETSNTAVTSGSSLIKTLGIIFISLGVLMIGGIIAFLKLSKKKQITPETPFSQIPNLAQKEEPISENQQETDEKPINNQV